MLPAGAGEVVVSTEGRDDVAVTGIDAGAATAAGLVNAVLGAGEEAGLWEVEYQGAVGQGDDALYDLGVQGEGERVELRPTAALIARRRLAAEHGIDVEDSVAYMRAFETAVAQGLHGVARDCVVAGRLPPGLVADVALFAAAEGEKDTLTLLFDSGVDVDLCHDDEPSTCLTAAAVHRQWGTVRYLVARGCNVDARDSDGDSALTIAAGHGAWQMVRELLAAGADVAAANRHGDSAARIAAHADRWEDLVVMLHTGRVAPRDIAVCFALAKRCGPKASAPAYEPLKAALAEANRQLAQQIAALHVSEKGGGAAQRTLGA
eukprot:TRINITY_DN8657_c0_g1_i1.p1 TRINITY_DN8657_c0_g1~~TRINITY_DN8657_c0_g1_i1.p1  ORF type:complete len:320 (+),score=101.81 TRINITY_DN8657_c0_g1_i1:63-1022(+)